MRGKQKRNLSKILDIPWDSSLPISPDYNDNFLAKSHFMPHVAEGNWKSSLYEGSHWDSLNVKHAPETLDNSTTSTAKVHEMKAETAAAIGKSKLPKLINT